MIEAEQTTLHLIHSAAMQEFLEKGYKSASLRNIVKTALCGVVGSERNYQRVWDSSQQAKSVQQAVARTGRFTEMGTRFLCLLVLSIILDNYSYQ